MPWSFLITLPYNTDRLVSPHFWLVICYQGVSSSCQSNVAMLFLTSHHSYNHRHAFMFCPRENGLKLNSYELNSCEASDFPSHIGYQSTGNDVYCKPPFAYNLCSYSCMLEWTWWLRDHFHLVLGILNGLHDDVIKSKHFPRYWSFVRQIHRSPVNSPHKGHWREALMLSLICARTNG